MTTSPNQSDVSTRPRGRKGRSAWLLALLLGACGGLYVGARWHDRIGPLLGVHAPSGGNVEQAPNGQKQLWTCGMHPQVIQDKPGDCPICHMKLTPLKADAPPAGHEHSVASGAGRPPPAQPGTQRKIKYWWDPMMNPPYISDAPGKSPMGMDLVPVYEEDGAGAAVVIDPAIVQNMGVRVATVGEGALMRAVRLFGYLDEAQPNIRDINLRVSGWVRRLYVKAEGEFVQEGDPLFDLYSPELQVAVEELIAGRRALNSAEESASRASAQTLYDAAARKLELLGLDARQIEPLSRLDRAPESITFPSPISGHVTQKPIVEGSAVMAGQNVLRIVDHSALWLDARVFEKDLPFARVGQDAEVSVASRPGGTVMGRIIFVHPHVDPMTRTTTVRLEILNPSLTLRPGMYATVRMEARLVDRTVLVPREAVIDTGDSQMAFVAEGVGRFTPRRVRMGLAGQDGLVQVIEGLAPGETVVTSGQFLIDSESRLREAIQKFLSQKQAAAADSVAAPPADSSPAGGAMRLDVTPDQQARIDAFLGEYLRVSQALGATQKEGTPLDPGALIAAAGAMRDALSGGAGGSLALEIVKATEALKGIDIDRQREAFGTLSEKVVALVDAAPPTPAVGSAIYLMNCPMTPHGKGDWLQTTEQVANPYFASEMKRCGTLVRRIAPKDGPQ